MSKKTEKWPIEQGYLEKMLGFEMSRLEGRILTAVEAALPSGRQCEALKDTMRNFFGDMRSANWLMFQSVYDKGIKLPTETDMQQTIVS